MTSLSLNHQTKQSPTASASWCVVGMSAEKSYLDRQPRLQTTVRTFATINLEAGS